MSRRLPRRRTVLITVAVIVVLLGGVTFGLGWYFSGEILSASAGGGMTFDERVLDSTARTVTLAASDDTARRGEFTLLWKDDRHAEVGDVVTNARGRVERTLLSGTPPPKGTDVAVANWAPTSDPATVGLDFQTVRVRTELGDAPAWYVPAGRDTWVIEVHGRNHARGARAEGLRVLPLLHRLDLPVLDISYRNDHGAPASPDEFSHLGESEWRDLDAAMRYAKGKGAQRFVLVGWSMGGMVITQALTHSTLAGAVDAVVLDAPAVDMAAAVDLQASQRGVPAFLTPLGESFADLRSGVDLDDLTALDHPPRVRPPTLLFHGDEDTAVPVESSRALAAAGKRLDWPIQYEEFPGAEHTGEWNSDQDRYERLLTAFLTEPGLLRG
jgi:uncharacterized protein